MKAHELLADRSKWTQGAIARNVLGQEELVHSPCAVCWCAMGAICLCHPGGLRNALSGANDASLRRYGMVIQDVNDATDLGYEAVMQVLREADV